MRLDTLEVTKVSLPIAFPPLPRWVSTPSKLPKYCYLSCSRLRPDAARRPRSYQSITTYRVPVPAQVRLDAFEITQVSLPILFLPLPRRGSTPSKLPKFRYLACPCPCPGGARSYQSIATYRVLALAQVGNLCSIPGWLLGLYNFYRFSWISTDFLRFSCNASMVF